MNLKKTRKIQLHGAANQVWNVKGDSTFETFNETDALAGDVWRCSADEQVVNDVSMNITVYKGDLIIAMVDTPGILNWDNYNNGNWDIIRKNPISEGTKTSWVHGGRIGEEAFDNDYRYLCTRSGDPETSPAAADGSAEWKKSPIMATV